MRVGPSRPAVALRPCRCLRRHLRDMIADECCRINSCNYKVFWYDGFCNNYFSRNHHDERHSDDHPDQAAGRGRHLHRRPGPLLRSPSRSSTTASRPSAAASPATRRADRRRGAPADRHRRRRQHRHRRAAAEGPPALPRVLRRRAQPAPRLRVHRVRGRRGRRPDGPRRAHDRRTEPRGRGERPLRPARSRPRRAERVGLSIEATVDRRDFGLDWNAELPSGGEVLDYEVQIAVELELVKEDE